MWLWLLAIRNPCGIRICLGRLRIYQLVLTGAEPPRSLKLLRSLRSLGPAPDRLPKRRNHTKRHDVTVRLIMGVVFFFMLFRRESLRFEWP